MSKLRLRISTSLDGFVAGPHQSLHEPLGIGGEQLHEWVVALEAWRRAHGKKGGEVNESTAASRLHRFVIELPANPNARALRRERDAGTLGPCVAFISSLRSKARSCSLAVSSRHV